MREAGPLVKFYAMKFYKVSNLGCKVAQFEGQQVRSLLERFGLLEAGPENPDLCVINTCAVTASAASKSRQAVRALARKFPDARLIVLGCCASSGPADLGDLPQLALLADHRRGILSALETFLAHHLGRRSNGPDNAGNLLSGDSYANIDIQTDCPRNVKDIFQPYPVEAFAGRHRAILKVQDGCDARCNYCIIPSLRPNLASAPKSFVLDQARRFLDAGHREIVLSGIFLGAYGRSTAKKIRITEPQTPFLDLIAELLALPGLGRLRLSSLEPMDLTPELIDILAASDKFPHHLHLPLQSGSDPILRRMGRQYRCDDYLRAVDAASSRLDDLALTTDLIVGFPGETQADFDTTLRIAERCAFAKIHIFPFSPRQGTPAYNWQNEMPSAEIIKDRAARLAGLEARLALDFRRRFLSRSVRVLVETSKERRHNGPQPAETGGFLCGGRADQYFPVRFTADADLDNRFVYVRVDQVPAHDQPARGTLVGIADNPVNVR